MFCDKFEILFPFVIVYRELHDYECKWKYGNTGIGLSIISQSTFSRFFNIPPILLVNPNMPNKGNCMITNVKGNQDRYAEIELTITSVYFFPIFKIISVPLVNPNISKCILQEKCKIHFALTCYISWFNNYFPISRIYDHPVPSLTPATLPQKVKRHLPQWELSGGQTRRLHGRRRRVFAACLREGRRGLSAVARTWRTVAGPARWWSKLGPDRWGYTACIGACISAFLVKKICNQPIIIFLNSEQIRV